MNKTENHQNLMNTMSGIHNRNWTVKERFFLHNHISSLHWHINIKRMMKTDNTIFCITNCWWYILFPQQMYYNMKRFLPYFQIMRLSYSNYALLQRVYAENSNKSIWLEWDDYSAAFREIDPSPPTTWHAPLVSHNMAPTHVKFRHRQKKYRKRFYREL
jgi:hypothetical protein